MAEPQRGEVPSGLDWDRIEAWAQQLAAGDLHHINAVFEANATVAPRIRWCPARDQIPTPQIRFLLDYWSNLKGQADLPKSDEVVLQHLASIQRYVALVDVIDDGRDCRYQRANPTMVALLGYDMTGMRVSDLLLSSYFVESLVAVYRAVYYRHEPLYTERPAAPTIYGSHFAVLPLADDGGKVVSFLVGVVPLGAGGLPIVADP